MSGRSLLRSPVQYLKGVGPRRAERFEKLDVRTGEDLLYHLPHRYEDATTVTPIASLETGDDATVLARVVSKGVISTRGGLRIFRAVLRDGSGLIEAAWPGQPWLDRSLDKGDLVLASGPVRFFHGRQLQPREHTVVSGAEEEESVGQVFPVYPATEGLSHRQIRRIVEQNLDALLEEARDRELFGEELRRELGLPRLDRALEVLHRPPELEAVEPARRRLAYEELFFLQLLHARARARREAAERGVAFDGEPALSRPFLAALPFELTDAQRRAWDEIRSDMASASRMYRLLQGDVGSGKTVVAAAAMLRAVESGWQAALMAPTELLAEQHARTLRELMEPVDVRPALLTGSVTGAGREEVLAGLDSGDVRLVVGTHALIQEGVAFDRLGLAVIDEQHRFGVEQRRELRDAGGASDTLVMSATPIPRSLALTLYGELDLSVIDEMPPGRKPVVTALRGPDKREPAFRWLGEQLAAGRQAYVVYPLVEESEAMDARSATAMHERLRERFPDREVGLLHGRMLSEEKDGVMRRFLAGEIDLLVATTVIEVGIDVPNASIMFVEDGERFGLSQLHQLRGRVGRGDEQSYCVVFHGGGGVPERLGAFASITDGFELSRVDLRLRGQGDLFGKEQHGLPQLRFADLERDERLVAHARGRAREIVREDPELVRPEHRPVARRLSERYGDAESLYGVG